MTAIQTGESYVRPRGRRLATVALWILQIALAVMLFRAGLSKLIGQPAMIQLFDAVGLGQWFRYVTGVVEVAGAIMLLLPALAADGALLLTGTMLGAIVTHLTVLHAPLTAPLRLLVGLLIVLYARRSELIAALNRFGP
jgi:uncharacterized membrane protein YphA (DoxX/SURF4 family)